jgi:hypothetical protein
MQGFRHFCVQAHLMEATIWRVYVWVYLSSGRYRGTNRYQVSEGKTKEIILRKKAGGPLPLKLQLAMHSTTSTHVYWRAFPTFTPLSEYRVGKLRVKETRALTQSFNPRLGSEYPIRSPAQATAR